MKNIMATLVGILAIHSAFSAEAGQEYIQSFEFDVKMQTLQDVKQDVTQEAILKKFKIRLPILPPRLDREQVKALVEKEIGARVEAAFPKSHFKQIEVDARYKFRQYVLNEFVEIRVLDRGINQFRSVKGYVRRIDKRGILLGDTPHIYSDMAPKELPHFFKKRRDDAIMRYISGQTKVYEYQRTQKDKTLRKDLLPKIWMDEGYVWNRRKQKWVAREEVFNFLYEKKLIEAFKEAKPGHAAVVLTRKGGLKFDDSTTPPRWIIPGEDPVNDPKDPIDQATKDAAKKNDESLKNWATKFDDIFSEKGDDVWNENDKGDAVPKGKKDPDKKDPDKKDPDKKDPEKATK